MTPKTISDKPGLRVAFFLNDFPVLSQTFILNQITGMIDLGVDVDIYAFRENKLEKRHEIIDQYNLLERVKYLSDAPKKRMAKLLHILRAILSSRSIKNFKPVFKSFNFIKFKRASRSLQLPCDVLHFNGCASYNIIHCQFGTIATRVLNLIEVGQLRGKLITTFRGYDATNYARQHPGVYNRLFAKGDYFLPVSESLKTSLIGLGCPDNKISVLHSGIKTENFSYKQRKISKGESINLLTIARLVEKKGVDIAIKSVAQVISDGVDVHYSLIGDGRLRDQLVDLTEQLGIADKVTFLGWRTHNEVIAQLDASHVLIAPSITADNGDQEGIPNVLKEAMAVGLPVIGTLHGGIPELIEHNKSGFLIAEKDVDALADSISYLYHHTEIWGTISLSARRVIEEEFDSNMINAKLLDIYNDLS